ncbi:MAG: helix-turn-helix domain-containing protein, partial [Halomonas sp. BM-2019]
TVASWFKAWEAEGVDGLRDKARSGRPPILDDQDHERLQKLVNEHPHQIKTIRARLHEETGVEPDRDPLAPSQVCLVAADGLRKLCHLDQRGGTDPVKLRRQGACDYFCIGT